MPQLVVIPGDGIGKEVIPVAVEILKAMVPKLQVVNAQAGWECFRQFGVSVPEETLTAIRESGSALFGAVSSPSGVVDGYSSAILTIRQNLDLYANIRPVLSWQEFPGQRKVDIIIVRENTEGLYSGREREVEGGAIAERVITHRASLRIAKKALSLAKSQKRRKITIVHKANVLPLTDGLFRTCVHDTAKEYADKNISIEIDELLVDVAVLKMLADPYYFDVVITTNLFGDILSDAAAHWCGGLGFAPSLNWGDDYAVAEPVHGSAPDIAGKCLANPMAAVSSAAMLVRYQWEMAEIANCIDSAVQSVLMKSNNEPLGSTTEITTKLLRALHRTGNK